MVGAVGDDEFGSKLVEGLQEQGIDTRDVRTVAGTNSGAAVIVVEESTGDNRIMISPGANASVTDIPPDLLNAEFTPPDVIVMQLEIPLDTVISTIHTASTRNPPTPIILNPAPALPLPGDLYPQIDILIINETEASALSGINVTADGPQGDAYDQALEALDWFAQHGGKDVIITLGAAGCVFYDGNRNEKECIPASKLDKVVDTTGAGDTFVGAIALRFAEHRSQRTTFDLKDAVLFATKASGWSVGHRGTWDAMPLASDITVQ
ncbi:hypothetical protein FRB99_007146 [Tulasnella sp. 403]|nr:hypothetical protein FRB99_007146 [Tulasnella sp. 403]